jgi:hypothetical protein
MRWLAGQIEDLAAVHELGEVVFTADLYPNLWGIWSEAEVGAPSEAPVIMISGR